jgi:hypothetical protein
VGLEAQTQQVRSMCRHVAHVNLPHFNRLSKLHCRGRSIPARLSHLCRCCPVTPTSVHCTLESSSAGHAGPSVCLCLAMHLVCCCRAAPTQNIMLSLAPAEGSAPSSPVFQPKQESKASSDPPHASTHPDMPLLLACYPAWSTPQEDRFHKALCAKQGHRPISRCRQQRTYQQMWQLLRALQQRC